MYEELKQASIDYCRKRELLITKDGSYFDYECSLALYAFQAGAEWMREYLEKQK